MGTIVKVAVLSFFQFIRYGTWGFILDLCTFKLPVLIMFVYSYHNRSLESIVFYGILLLCAVIVDGDSMAKRLKKE